MFGRQKMVPEVRAWNVWTELSRQDTHACMVVRRLVLGGYGFATFVEYIIMHDDDKNDRTCHLRHLIVP